MFPLHVALHHFVNLFKNDLAIGHSTNGVVFDQCHGNKGNRVAASTNYALLGREVGSNLRDISVEPIHVLGPVQTSNFTCAQPRDHLSPLK